MPGMVLYGLLFPSLGIHLIARQTNPGSSAPLSLTQLTKYWCYLYLIFLSLTLLTHPTHSYLLLPHLIFHDSESAYSFYLCPPPMSIIRVCLCAGPTLNHVVYSVWGLLLAFPSLDINLSQLCLSSLQQPSFQEL